MPAIKRRIEKTGKLGKLTLPPIMEMLISSLALHHDPKICGKDVHLFKLERFEGGVATIIQQHLYSLASVQEHV